MIQFNNSVWSGTTRCGAATSIGGLHVRLKQIGESSEKGGIGLSWYLRQPDEKKDEEQCKEGRKCKRKEVELRSIDYIAVPNE